MQVPKILNPKLEPAAIGAAAAAVYAAVAMVVRWRSGGGVLEQDVIVAAVVAVYGLYVRAKATPVADPHDKAGRPLTPDEPTPGNRLAG
ncbi:hypothetical protein [Actinomadura sp. 21ATH]|uniref:hypothetical protein n=1 Tax=Actinomadura sp. 21ATH TaxID=1735444 RepID=UPI0035C1E5E4